jgi:hypothetical protein
MRRLGCLTFEQDDMQRIARSIALSFALRDRLRCAAMMRGRAVV